MSEVGMIRGAANRILRIASTVLPSCDQEWGAAMRNEASHIDQDFTALLFSLSCLRSAYGRKLKAEAYAPLGRLFLGLCILIWAAAKFYASVYMWQSESLVFPIYQIIFMVLAGLLFLWAGQSLVSQHWPSVAVSLLLVLSLNSAHLLIAAFYEPCWGFCEVITGPHITYSLALISEEYFVLSLTCMGAMALWAWPTVLSRYRRSGL